MPFFEFLHPDKSPPNARMPKRLNTLKRKKRQTTHTPRPHYKIPPKFRKYHDCTLQVSHVHRCQVSTHPTKYPEVSQCAKIQGFGLSKMTLQVSRCLPKPPTDTLQFLNLQNHLSRSQKVTKRHTEFLYTHEVREFLTIQRPNTPRTNTPRSLLGSLIASKIRYLSRENFTPWGLDLPPPAPPRTGGNPSVCVPKNA